jgi:hypothetical protein
MLEFSNNKEGSEIASKTPKQIVKELNDIKFKALMHYSKDEELAKMIIYTVREAMDAFLDDNYNAFKALYKKALILYTCFNEVHGIE